jgi:uncharacterized protein YjlB
MHCLTAVFGNFILKKRHYHLYSNPSIIVADERACLILSGFVGRKLQYDLQ